MDTVKPLISVIVVTWNSQDTLRACLDSIAGQMEKGQIEILVVDNASSDGTRSEARLYPDVRVIRNPSNLGYCTANNQGIRQARGDYFLLLNPDANLTPGYLPQVFAAMENHPDVALATGKILRMDRQGQPIQRDGYPVIDSAGLRLRRNRQAEDIGRGEEDRGQYGHEKEVFGVCGAVCLCRKQALLEAMVDGQVFDDAFFAYKEDVDLSWRLQKLGWKALYTPKAVAYHARGWPSSFKNREQVSPFVRQLSFRNRRLAILKNDRLGEIFPDLLPVLGFELASFGYVILKEPYLLRAYVSILKGLPHVIRWRKAIRQRLRERAAQLRGAAGFEGIRHHPDPTG